MKEIVIKKHFYYEMGGKTNPRLSRRYEDGEWKYFMLLQKDNFFEQQWEQFKTSSRKIGRSLGFIRPLPCSVPIEMTYYYSSTPI